MYGEQLLVTLRALAASKTKAWSAANFGTQFLNSFGPGGSYVGYADKATKGTVYNLLAQSDALAAAIAPPAGFTDGAVRMALYKGLKGLAAELNREELAAAAEKLALDANPEASAAAVEYARSAAGKVEEALAKPTGADDAQGNALAKLPALVGRYAGHAALTRIVTEATRQTANNEEAVTWCVFASLVLEAVVVGATVADAVRTQVMRLEQPFRAVVEHAVRLAGEEEDTTAGVAMLGQACDLAKTVPASIYLALRASASASATESAYVAGVRANIMAGGDSNGRACFLGALLAAAGGASASPVPADWIARLVPKDELLRLSSHLHHAPKEGEEAADHIAVHHHHHSSHGGAAASGGAGSAHAPKGDKKD